ncbi:MAG: hypothetical protein M3Q97_00195 [Bacteroidota bacterium]|nr:hypothetical protein [Bacteroidota bacterium]
MYSIYLQTALMVFLLLCSAAYGQQGGIPDAVLKRGDTTQRDTAMRFRDMQNMGDLLKSNKYLLGKDVIMGHISYNTGRILVSDNGTTKEVWRQALGLFTKVRFYKEFAVNTNFFYNFNKEAKARWTPDFQYSFGKFDWRPNTWNYGYENYSNNFYSDSPKELWEKFLEGYYFLSYQHSLPSKIMSKIRLDETSDFMIMYFVRYALKYSNTQGHISQGIFRGKPVFSIASRYTIFKRFYVEGAVNQFVNPKLQKMPWDADFTYGFGYYDWRSFRISVMYGNYSVNRFPWNPKEMPEYGFWDGNFTVALNYIW